MNTKIPQDESLKYSPTDLPAKSELRMLKAENQMLLDQIKEKGRWGLGDMLPIGLISVIGYLFGLMTGYYLW